jgi:hypothetical protein
MKVILMCGGKWVNNAASIAAICMLVIFYMVSKIYNTILVACHRLEKSFRT